MTKIKISFPELTIRASFVEFGKNENPFIFYPPPPHANGKLGKVTCLWNSARSLKQASVQHSKY